MAVCGVLGDIHGNAEALAAVLAALERRGVERLLCLGDIVGYNADPDECVDMLRRRGVLSIAGNHDLISIGRLDFRRCSGKARYALKRTRRVLGAPSAAYLAALPPHTVPEEGIVLVHGGVRDVQQYLRTPQHILQNAALLRADFPAARLCFFGHSHEQRVYEVRDGSVRELPAALSVGLDPGVLNFVNPGSVDASRKVLGRLAECAVLDTQAWRVDFLRVPYDAGATEAKAAAFGYRIPPWAEHLHTARRRLGRALSRG